MIDYRRMPALEDLDAVASAYADRSTTATIAQRTDLREQFTRDCLPFAGRLARRYRGRGEAADDLEQVARLGLVKAIDRYDPARGSFTAYAVTTISGEIKRHFRDRSWGVHVPRGVQELSLEIRSASAKLAHDLGRTPTTAEIARHLNVDEPAVRDALGSSAGRVPSSLNAPIAGSDGASELGDLFGDVDSDLELVDDRTTLARLLRRLPARERRLLALRFYGNRTQSEIADDLGVSQMQVSRLLSRTLDWLRAAMLSDVTPPWKGADGPDHESAVALARRDAGTIVVELFGEVDQDTADRVRHTLRGAVGDARGDGVLVDLTGVPMVDAAAVAVLVDAASAAAVAGVSLRLDGARPFVARVLTNCGLGRLLNGDGRQCGPRLVDYAM